MAVDEAICNIHRHGYAGEVGKATLRIRTSSSPAPNIEIQICDEAMQVEKESIKSRKLDEVRPGGLGVHLIQTVMDEAIWAKREHCGMSLTMKKTFSLPQPSKSEVHQHE
jgi:anti-sigma regulatory factor (Ser/Thr protein kinase)